MADMAAMAAISRSYQSKLVKSNCSGIVIEEFSVEVRSQIDLNQSHL